MLSGMRLRAFAALLFAAAAALAVSGCGARDHPYRFASPMLGHADVPSHRLPDGSGSSGSSDRPSATGRPASGRPHRAYGWQADSQAGIRTVSAHGIEVTMPPASAEAAASITHEQYAREIVWSQLPAPHKETGVAATPVREPSDLRALVGQRDKRDPFTLVIDWLGELGLSFDRASASDGPALVAWAEAANKLQAPTDCAPGDILVFDRAVGEMPSDLIALVIARDTRGVIEFMYSGAGVIRRGFLDPTRPDIRRDLDGSVVNTFLRHGKHWPPKGTRYLAGELLAHVVRVR